MQIQEITIPEQKNIHDRVFPAAFQCTAESKEDFWAWVNNHATWLRDTMCTHGALLLRGAPVSSPEDFARFADEAKFPPMPYVGGAAPRSAVTSRVLTSNESPPSEPIPFHHEMAQVPKPPAYIFFYCDLPPQEGGATAIAHSVHSYELFHAIDPAFAQKIEKTGVCYVRIMPDQDDVTSAIGRSWRSTFQTNDKMEAEQKMKEAGMTWEWLSNGDLKTRTDALPAIRIEERTQQKTFFNSMVAAYTGWIDSRNDPKQSVLCGDGSSVDGSVLELTASRMKADSVAIQWQKGDVLCIDNHLVLHAREPFSGERRILATISWG